MCGSREIRGSIWRLACREYACIFTKSTNRARGARWAIYRRSELRRTRQSLGCLRPNDFCNRSCYIKTTGRLDRLLFVTVTDTLANIFVPVLQVLFYFLHKLAGVGAIDDAMIEAKRQANDAANGD